MEEFLTFVTRYDPGFLTKVVPALADDLAEFDRLVGVPIPHFYRTFLAEMGNGCGPLRLFHDAKYYLSYLIPYYTKYVITGERKVPADCMVIAAGGGYFPGACLQLGNREDGLVFDCEDEMKVSRYADSFRQLLFCSAFGVYRPNQFPISAIYWAKSQVDSRTAVCERLARNGFEICPFSDSLHLCADRADAAISGTQNTQQIAFRIAGSSKTIVEAIALAIGPIIPLELSQWVEPVDVVSRPSIR